MNEQPKPKDIEILRCVFVEKNKVRVLFLDETQREDSVIVDVEVGAIQIRHARDLCWTKEESEVLKQRARMFHAQSFGSSAFKEEK